MRLTRREPGSGPGRLHLLSGVRQHVVALGLVDQVAARLRRLDQLLVVDHVEQVGRVDEGQAHGGQQLRQVLPEEGGDRQRFQQTPRKTVEFSVSRERVLKYKIICDVTKGTGTKHRKCCGHICTEAGKQPNIISFQVDEVYEKY